jgi:hypothetical protein
MPPVRCSPIWAPRSPTARTASTGSVSCAVIVSTPSVRRPRPRRCGGWSINASTPRTCRGSAHLPGVRAVRAAARAGAWTAGAAPAAGGWLHIDIDATLVIDHSDNQQSAAPTWKKTFGHHPLLAFLDRPEIAGGEALAGPASLAFFLQICCVLALVFGAVNGVSYKGEPRCQYRKSVRE